MQKSELKQSILRSYQSLEPNVFNELDSVLSKLETESENTQEMAKQFSGMVEYQLLHEAFLRKKADLTNSSASTIKVIVVVYFICSIISAFYLFDKIFM